MIPEGDKQLTITEQARWNFTKMAAGLVRLGVPMDVVMVDAREGCNAGAEFMARQVSGPW